MRNREGYLDMTAYLALKNIEETHAGGKPHNRRRKAKGGAANA